MKRAKTTGDLSGLRRELELFIYRAQHFSRESPRPLDTYVGELSDILRKVLGDGVDKA
ncbi:hypothetical protein [Paenibacillus sp. GYB003]|uniref:hypothetical protein n=1 Tax=Paenibacillus sp. GYB003 TaxID=2994392 RepID=UPI002F962447